MTRSLAIAVLATGAAIILGAGAMTMVSAADPASASRNEAAAQPAAGDATAAVNAAPLLRGDPAKGQVIAGQVCAACHGADGNSAIADNPVLAGQHAGYISKQLADYKSGLRQNAIMQGFAAALSAEDMLHLGAFYSRQPVKPRPANDRELAMLGQQLYRAGDASKGLPSCAGCHSPNGVGIPAQYPRLAGQHTEYTLLQLRAFRAGERANDMNQMMRTIAGRLTDREMAALAEYVTGLTGAP